MSLRSIGIGLVVLAPLLSGCAGSIPTRDGEPQGEISAVIIGSKLVGQTGETRSGRVWINLEEEGGAGNVYLLPLPPGQPLLYQIEPGLYKLSPTRNLLGWRQDQLTIAVEHHTYRVPFPRQILRREAMRAKSRKILPIGVVVAKVQPALPGRAPDVQVWLEDDVDTRRHLVQDLIRGMMDPNAPPEFRSSAIAWTRALDQTLVDVLAEPEKPVLYKKVH